MAGRRGKQLRSRRYREVGSPDRSGLGRLGLSGWVGLLLLLLLLGGGGYYGARWIFRGSDPNPEVPGGLPGGVDFAGGTNGASVPPLPSPSPLPLPLPLPLPVPPAFDARASNAIVRGSNRTEVVIQVSTNIVPSEVGLGRTGSVAGTRFEPIEGGRSGRLLGESETLENPQTWLLAQIALAAHGISPGPIDGQGGNQSVLALQAFQTQRGLKPTGRLDADTQAALRGSGPAAFEFAVTAEDLSRLHAIPSTWLGKAALRRLDFETLPELLGERFHCTPVLIRRLNPEVAWDRVVPGQSLRVPRVEYPPARRAALLRISLAGKWLRAFDETGRLLAHFPCSIGSRVDKRPVGMLRVTVAVKDPNYTFDPATFPESAEAQSVGRKLLLPPGPNNPVGVAWIGLNRSGYGIHGTPSPEQVGRTESHGCFRLANWNAEYLRQMSWSGLPVRVEP